MSAPASRSHCQCRASLGKLHDEPQRRDGRQHAGRVRRGSCGSRVLGRRSQRRPLPRRQPHRREDQPRLARQRRHRRAGRHGRHQRRRRHGVRERAGPVVPAARDAPPVGPGGHARHVGGARRRVGEDDHPGASSPRRRAA